MMGLSVSSGIGMAEIIGEIRKSKLYTPKDPASMLFACPQDLPFSTPLSVYFLFVFPVVSACEVYTL